MAENDEEQAAFAMRAPFEEGVTTDDEAGEPARYVQMRSHQVNCRHGREPERCAKCRVILNGMMSGFQLVGPIEAAIWLADYFTDVATKLKTEGHGHAGYQDTVILFCDEVRIVAERFRPILRAGKVRRQ